MGIRRCVTLAAGVFLVACGTAGAQEPGKAGVTIAYPGAIGIIWHASDKVAIRPDFSFGHSSSDVVDSSSWNFTLNLSALFYVKKYDNVRAYVSPRFSYARSSSTTTPTSTQPAVAPLTSTSNAPGGAGLFGVQYSPGSHFSVFGEVGLAFSHRTSEASIATTTKFTSTAWGTTAGVGVIFYP